MKTVDLVVPCYNEEDGLAVFVEETTAVIETIDGYTFRFILVNDGSKDNTYLVMKELAEKYSNVAYISLSRNFGKESAMYAGLKYSGADYVVVMDADLQHPPKMLIDMCQAIEEMRAEERAKGILETLVSLVKDGILTLSEAAKRANMTVEDFEKQSANLT